MEKEFKGTKGEWSYSPMKGTVGHCQRAQVWDSEGLNLASIDSRYGEVEASENAKLIASAPDLLKALQLMVEMYEEVQPAGGYQGFYDEAVASIKKALD